MSQKQLNKALSLAGVPEHLYQEAEQSQSLAKRNIKGLTLSKWIVRLFKAKKIASLLEWEDNRLCLKHPELADEDVAPVENIGCNGDHFPWKETPEGGRPNPDAWMNKDPTSADYQEAVNHPSSKRYFKGNHPRSRKAREMWYRRNAGEYKAYRLGAPIDPSQGFEIWRGQSGKNTAVVWRCCDAWMVNTSTHIIGSLYWNSRKGFEIDNVYCGDYSPQMWWPIADVALHAPVTWSAMPGKTKSLDSKKWETLQPNGDGKTYSLIEDATKH